MRMDTVIMGGGLSGLTCGIALAKRGQRVTIVASGQSTLLFNGGSMELLGRIDGKAVQAPLEAIPTLPQEHPYSKIGASRIADLANEAKELLADADNMLSSPGHLALYLLPVRSLILTNRAYCRSCIALKNIAANWAYKFSHLIPPCRYFKPLSGSFYKFRAQLCSAPRT